MIFPPVYEFGSVMVFQPGVPNAERIVFRPTEVVDLSRYAIWIAWRHENQTIVPLRDYSFWFGVRSVSPPCWIVVYTGEGDFREAHHPDTNEPVYCFHWGRKETLFQYRQIVPVVYRYDSFSIGGHMAPLPSLTLPPPKKQISQ